METFDFVIVGSGSAASIIASRLAAAGRTVCVLEAGPPDSNPFIRMPAGFIKTLFDPKVTWQFATAPNPHTNDRPIQITQGRTLGGSSSVNGMVYNRGQAADYDTWAQMGLRGWGHADLLDYFRRTEQRMGEADDRFRGREGPVTTSISPWPNAITDAFLAAAVAAGYPRNPDYNGESHDGAGLYQSTIQNGRRVSTASAFLDPARRAHGVDVRTRSLATRIILQDGRAVGVEYVRDGSPETRRVLANQAVVVSAGVTNSPKLLQLSGLGPADLLRRHGVAVSQDLPGVGRNLRDHYSPRLVARARTGVDSINGRVTGLPLAMQFARWLVGRPSVLALSPAQAHVFGRTDPALDVTDFALVFAPGSFRQGFIGRLDDFPGMTCGAWVMRPDSAGRVEITSSDPRDAPLIDPNYMSAETDRRKLVAALKIARSLLASPAMRAVVEAEIFPGPDVVTDDEWLAFARQYGNSAYHLVGTCRMGADSDPMAVVDDRLRVRGVRGLVVADASVMPTLPSANTAAPSMMIGEKASDLLLGR